MAHRRGGWFLVAVVAPVAVLLVAVLMHRSATALSPDGKALLSLLPTAPSLVLPSWDPSSATPCSWQGVTCSLQSQVVSLSLPNTFLNLSYLPPPLTSLSSLQLLNLSTCNISRPILSSYASLAALRLLDLSSNGLSDAIPIELGVLSGLHYLFLNSNQFTGGIPRSLANLSLLEVLCIQDNFNDTIPASLGALTALQRLRAGGNPGLLGPIPASLGAKGSSSPQVWFW